MVVYRGRSPVSCNRPPGSPGSLSHLKNRALVKATNQWSCNGLIDQNCQTEIMMKIRLLQLVYLTQAIGISPIKIV